MHLRRQPKCAATLHFCRNFGKLASDRPDCRVRIGVLAHRQHVPWSIEFCIYAASIFRASATRSRGLCVYRLHQHTAVIAIAVPQPPHLCARKLFVGVRAQPIAHHELSVRTHTRAVDALSQLSSGRWRFRQQVSTSHVRSVCRPDSAICAILIESDLSDRYIPNSADRQEEDLSQISARAMKLLKNFHVRDPQSGVDLMGIWRDNFRK